MVWGTWTTSSIGRAAEKLGLATSALRYYDARGLVRPRQRHGAHRVYDPAELRALAFVKIASELGLPLGTAEALLNAATPQWHTAVRDQVDELKRLIAQTQRFLAHALDCPADRPVQDCPVLTSVLDQILEGTSLDELLAAHAATDPPIAKVRGSLIKTGRRAAIRAG